MLSGRKALVVSMLNRIALPLAAVGLLASALAFPSNADAQAPPPARRASLGERSAAEHFVRIRRDPPALRAFLRAFPKGADLHNHLSGAIYAESYIRWAAELPLCVELSSFTFIDARNSQGTCANPETERPAAQLLVDPILYRRSIDALSVRNWQPTHASGHDQFFDTFVKFAAVLNEGRDLSAVLLGRGVAEVMNRAAVQNVRHLELMSSFDSTIDVPAPEEAWASDAYFDTVRARLLATADFKQRVTERRRWLDAVEGEARRTLGCGTPAALPGCHISVRYIAYALRGLPPHQVFAQMVFAFELAALDSRVVAVNLVMPEDWFVPMRDYDLHMRMFGFFRRLYPAVNVALHAGELALGLVPPEQLGRHIRQAIEVGGAQRIGHGTDVMNDVDPGALLREMARRRTAVEISLSSSDVILGVRGERHPLREYLRAGVPVVLATDDEGVARSDLTNEYQRAVEEHGLSYMELKQLSRNSVEFSFLPADEKARARKELEAAFDSFESKFGRQKNDN